ncbi:hypothetical protein M5K25_021792 [Dendrobium thyrsiflorum]|uniref:Uncharacterized protein n=1 Tax=Dendrobium thyrsiflorum TaxID=117978 RepID=A0ABD0U5J4_DENTH
MSKPKDGGASAIWEQDYHIPDFQRGSQSIRGRKDDPSDGGFGVAEVENVVGITDGGVVPFSVGSPLALWCEIEEAINSDNNCMVNSITSPITSLNSLVDVDYGNCDEVSPLVGVLSEVPIVIGDVVNSSILAAGCMESPATLFELSNKLLASCTPPGRPWLILATLVVPVWFRVAFIFGSSR